MDRVALGSQRRVRAVLHVARRARRAARDRAPRQPASITRRSGRPIRRSSSSPTRTTRCGSSIVDHPAPVKIDQSRLDEPISVGERTDVVARLAVDRRTRSRCRTSSTRCSCTRSPTRRRTSSPTRAATHARRASIAAASIYGSSRARTRAGCRRASTCPRSVARRPAASTAIVLRKDLPSPFAPESDEEGCGLRGSGAEAAKGEPAKTDAHRSRRRSISASSLRRSPRANYVELEVADGALFVMSTRDRGIRRGSARGRRRQAPAQVQKFDLKTRKLDKFIDKLDQPDFGTSDSSTFELSADGDEGAVRRRRRVVRRRYREGRRAGRGRAQARRRLQVWVDPRAEWKQMFHEVWRIERDFLYDPKAHGLDLAQAEKVYAPFVDGHRRSRRPQRAVRRDARQPRARSRVRRRWRDAAAGPRGRSACSARIYAIEDGHYKIAQHPEGRELEPAARRAAHAAGRDVKEGDFILAVNGVAVTRRRRRSTRYMLGTANKRTVLTLAASGDGKDKHDVTVVPIADEGQLRLREWMEDNRRRVDELSNGKLAYVYIPDTASGGLHSTSTATTSRRSTSTASSSTSASTTAASSRTT